MGVSERREREREVRRNQIIDAAERIFFDTGPMAATMEDVARAAELSKGTLYLYFNGKDDLYLAIADRFLSTLVEALEGVSGSRLSGADLFERYLEVFHDLAKAHPDHMKTVLTWMASGFRADPENPALGNYLELVARVQKRVVGVIELGKRDGSVRPEVDSLQTMMHMWGGSMGLWLLSINRAEVQRRMPAAVDFDTIVPSFHQTLARSIRAEGEP